MHDLYLLIAQYGLLLVFVNVLFEQGGVPIPAYPALMVAAAISVDGTPGYDAAHIVLVATAAALVADLGWYWSGRRFGRRILGVLCKVSLSPDYCVRQTDSLYAKWGLASLAFAKFVPGFATLAATLAGTTRANVAAFLFFDAIGALLWAGLAVTLGVVFHDAIDEALEVLAQLGLWGLAVLIAALAAFVLAKWWQRQRFIRQLRMDRITVGELRSLIDSGSAPLIIDVRGHAAAAEEGTIPGALITDLQNVGAAVGALARDHEVVVYCRCPNEASAAQAARILRRLGFQRVRPLLGGVDAWLASFPRSSHGRSENSRAQMLTAVHDSPQRRL